MAQYKTGLVSVTNGSPTVTGAGTLWVGEVSVGDIFTIVGSNAWYEVGAVDSNTQVTLTSNYAGTTASDASYAISRDFTANYGLPYPQKGDIETASLIKRAFQDIDSKLVLTSSNGDVTVTGDLIVEGSTISLDNATVQTFTWGDNDKAIFGAGSDLQIYHDGTHSRIVESGSGDMIIQGDEFSLMNVAGTEYMIYADNDSFVKLYYDGAAKLATTSTGIDVTGTVVADGLTVDGSASFSAAAINIDLIETNVVDENTRFRQNAGNLDIQTVDDASSLVTTRLRLDHSSGDISFYEDTGTTSKFFWDASAESLGIGTSSPASSLHVNDDGSYPITLTRNDGTDSNTTIRWKQATTSWYAGVNSSNSFAFQYNNSDLSSGNDLTITSAGLVGIGTSSPATKLHVSTGTASAIGTYARIENNRDFSLHRG
jgi:hypothetical protein